MQNVYIYAIDDQKHISQPTRLLQHIQIKFIPYQKRSLSHITFQKFHAHKTITSVQRMLWLTFNQSLIANFAI